MQGGDIKNIVTSYDNIRISDNIVVYIIMTIIFRGEDPSRKSIGHGKVTSM